MSNDKYKYTYVLNDEIVQTGEDSHCKLLRMVVPGSVVLECGPAYGMMTKYLQENLHCEVHIIEYDTDSFENAIKYAKSGVCADIEKDDWLNRFDEQYFDYIIYADILEHLHNPEAVLAKMRRFLKPDGNVLLSVPNVAHGDIIMNLLRDRFNYTAVGLLDNTHIHLFARENIWTMVKNAGYYIVEESTVRNGLFSTEQGKNLSLEFAEDVKRFFASYPNKDVYQYIYQLALQETSIHSEIGIIKECSDVDLFNPVLPVINSSIKKDYFGKVYFDYGGGLSEENSVQIIINDDSRMKHRIALSDACQSVRFDPVEGFGCLVWDLQVRCSSQFLQVKSHNGHVLNDIYIFRTDDPQIYLEPLPVGSKWLEIEAEIICFEEAAWTKLVQEIESIERDKVKLLTENEQFLEEYALAMQQAELDKQSLKVKYESDIQEQKQQFAKDKFAVEETFKQKLVEQKQLLVNTQQLAEKEKFDLQQDLINITKQKEIVERELLHCKNDFARAISQCNDFQQQTEYWQNSYNVINDSQFWKITKPGRVIMDCLKYPFKKNSQSSLFTKGWRCLKDNGFGYTWKKVQQKLCLSVADEPLMKIDKKAHPCLGQISKETDAKVCNTITDIIVPVYNGFEYLEQLFRTIERTKAQYRLIIIDDKSSDERVLPFLQEYAKQRDNVLILENKSNQGFVKTVNRGLREAKNNVALVNTDVELPADWLERLMAPIVCNKMVATATPFTNSGTICSFPDFCADNELFWGMNLNDIDSVFREYTPEYPIIPTGVGFCMGMSRKAIDKIGDLDAETFGKGYGEENDWCRRASEIGFVNVHVDNLFVYHKHGGSFASEEKQALIKDHLKRLVQKHPDYNRLVEDYCQADPCAWLRNEVKKKLLHKFSKVSVVVAFTHSWGGGASMYLDRERSKVLSDGKEFVQIEYLPQMDIFKVEYYYGNYYEKININADFKELCQILPVKIAEIWLNELVSYPKLYDTLLEIITLVKSKNAYLLFLLHDFFALCPTINLLDFNGEYCNVPEKTICQNCLDRNERFGDIHQKERRCGISVWREKWFQFFSECTEIRTFSKSSRDIFNKAYPGVDKEKITVCPHIIDYLPKIDTKKKFTTTLNIAVIGAIDEIKGVDIVSQMAKLIRQYGLNVTITVIGYTHPEISKNLCVTTGKYSRCSLPAKILENDIDVVFIPSIWPETFSYTSQEAMLMGLPVACFDIGAPVERIKEYNKGLVIPQINADLALQKIMQYGEKYIFKEIINYKKVLFITENTKTNFDYRIKCFQEKLMFCGVDSEVISLDKTIKKDLKDFSAIIFYCCSSVIRVSYLCNKAKKMGIKLFFDVDDFAFDTEIINSSGLSYKEKQQNLLLAEGYREVMQLCDGLIASTEALTRYLRISFADKSVCIYRNSIDLEMETILVCAGYKDKFQNSDVVYLTYFNEFGLSDNNFELIAQPLVNILEKYANAKVQVYGCLHIPNMLKKYASRIEMYDFVSNQQALSDKLAQTQICLVPLDNAIFNLCKSENRYIEAALARIPVVASYNDELALVIENGVNGFLCKNGQEWESILGCLIESADLRNSITKRAQTDVLQTHLTRNSSNKIVEFIIGSISDQK